MCQHQKASPPKCHPAGSPTFRKQHTGPALGWYFHTKSGRQATVIPVAHLPLLEELKTDAATFTNKYNRENNLPEQPGPLINARIIYTQNWPENMTTARLLIPVGLSALFAGGLIFALYKPENDRN